MFVPLGGIIRDVAKVCFKKSLLSGREFYRGWEESSLDQILLSIQSHQVNISHPTDSSQDIKREKKDHKVVEMSITLKVATANIGSLWSPRKLDF